MADDERSKLVEFVGSDATPGTDETLPAPAGAQSLRLRLAGGAAVLVAVALVVRAAGHNDRPAPPPPAATSSPAAVAPAAPVVSPSFAPAPTRAPVPAAGRLRQIYGGHGPGSCPTMDNGMPTCTGADHVPAPVLTAARAHVPGLQIEVALDEQLRDIGFGPGGLWYREIDGVLAGRAVVVAVHRHEGGDVSRVLRFRSARGTTLMVTRALGKYTVRVQVTAPPGSSPSPVPLTDLLALAVDPRLLVRG